MNTAAILRSDLGELFQFSKWSLRQWFDKREARESRYKKKVSTTSAAASFFQPPQPPTRHTSLETRFCVNNLCLGASFVS